MDEKRLSQLHPPLPASAPLSTSRSTSRRPTFASRAFRVLVLLSAGAALTTIFPALRISSTSQSTSTSAPHTASLDPVSEWKDDVWPLRPPTPWDISTDFPFPRTLEYDVTEGTWLRLDVHPKSGEVVFDMLGDIYCLPASAYTDGALQENALRTRAVPVLVGVPHDSDPHFSPDGSKVVFRSDAELGVENIWVVEWKGCEASDLRPTHAKVGSSELAEALAVKLEEEDLLAKGVKEDERRKRFRLIREGRLQGMS